MEFCKMACFYSNSNPIKIYFNDFKFRYYTRILCYQILPEVTGLLPRVYLQKFQVQWHFSKKYM